MAILKWAGIDGFLRRDAGRAIAVLIYGPDGGAVRERARQLVISVAGSLDDPFAVMRLDDAALGAFQAGGAQLRRHRGGEAHPALGTCLARGDRLGGHVDHRRPAGGIDMGEGWCGLGFHAGHCRRGPWPAF